MVLGSTGTVTISGPAPASGLVVELASDKPSVSLPSGSSVNIAAGTKTATFAIATGAVTATQVATITGTLNATSQSAKLTVIPATATADGNLFLRLVITPKSVLGGGIAVAEVSLVSATDGVPVPAPAGGATINLVSDQPETVVSGLPPQVVIPAGESKIAF